MGSSPPPGAEAVWKREAAEVFRAEREIYESEREAQFFFRTQIAIVQRMLAGAKGRLLAIGCAAGGEIPPLRAMGFDLVGIDLIGEMLVPARRRFAGDAGVTFCRADIEKLPFAAESFDAVVCLGVFEYVPSYEPSLGEIRRVLRPGGRALISLPSRVSAYETGIRVAQPLLRWAKKLAGRATAATPPQFRNLCDPPRLRELARAHGLAPKDDAFTAFLIYPLDRLSPALFDSVARALEPLSSVPGLRTAASQYLLSVEKSA